MTCLISNCDKREIQGRLQKKKKVQRERGGRKDRGGERGIENGKNG